jgi:hypothetical protein
MTPQDIITEARYILNDTESTRYRNTDAELLGWVNDALDVMVGERPELFVTVSDHTCTVGVEQSPTFARLVRVLGVNRVVGGNALLQADRATLDAFLPGWRELDSAAAVHWLPHPDPKKFYLYPPAAISQAVEVPFVQAPATLLIGDTIPVSENFRPALLNFVVGMAETKDDEHVDSGRAAQAKSDFVAMITKGA